MIERFVEHSPMTLMARLILQCALDAEWVTDLFEEGDARNSLPFRELLSTTTVDVMSTIAARLRRTEHEAARTPRELTVSITALHDRISRTQPAWGRALVRESAQRLSSLVQPLPRELPASVSGYRLRILDGAPLPVGEKCAPGSSGDCLSAVTPLNRLRGAALAGQPFVVYDPDLAMIVDLVPCERGETQERVITGALLDTVQPGELWIIDRRFSTRAVLSGWPRRASAFIVQEHGCTPEHRELDSLVAKGRVETGLVYEQPVGIVDELGASIVFRRIELHLDRGTDEGDKVIRILTNVPASHLSAQEIARLSCRRWSHTLPVPLEPLFSSEVLSLGQPRAALLTFGVAAFAYNVLSAIARAVSSRHALNERELERLPSYIATGVSATYAGMMIALPDEFWQRCDQLMPSQVGDIVKGIAAHVDPRSSRKQQREPKVPPVTAAMLRAATIDSLVGKEGSAYSDAEPLAEQRAIAMATRDFSSNPSKALRDAAESPVMVTKYGQAIAFLISVEDWNRMKADIRESSLDRLAVGYAGAAQAEIGGPVRKSSIN
ncbi:MAG TPA: type II toxin-antitoxin system Phd/YefM family antitoxin [Paraburkholderia sp.]